MGFLGFLAGVAFISLSGVMMPGPVFAVTLAKGQRQPLAGVWISLGHGMVELPLVLLIYLGLGRLFTDALWKAGVGLLGGAVLVITGFQMVRARNETRTEGVEVPYRTLAAGLVTSAANPYFFIWWATVGAALVLKAAAWGFAGVAVFYVVHWLCDFGWHLLLSAGSHRAGGLWSPTVHRLVFGGCGLVLAGFGLWFIRGALAGPR